MEFEGKTQGIFYSGIDEKKLIIIFIVKDLFSAKSDISSCENDTTIKILKKTLKKSIIFY
jgi:hypothetical protein